MILIHIGATRPKGDSGPKGSQSLTHTLERRYVPSLAGPSQWGEGVFAAP
jgi:hypothetical protein